jgi:hypothetical protein
VTASSYPYAAIVHGHGLILTLLLTLLLLLTAAGCPFFCYTLCWHLPLASVS